ncbi:LssY C-terminal domain-containing protein [Sphingomonas abietis]|uniref:LssY C-terminal domain-containing protein n=1 Tax=Sphingomonas abietis TaxID=3012344 RepID=A0ABY7NSK1_9SPHN|nr:LssY C-terminal domain-containing protein [Sphingomonas abietis]WBO22934.1 LssY C-terminal domain-containing protein [Sphingomonas abietis]
MTDFARARGQQEQPSQEGHSPSRSFIRRVKPWHWYSIAGLVIVGLPALWIALAYGGLPRLWSHHEHKRIGSREEIVSYTAQDIPADPINLHLKGNQGAIVCAFKRAGWSVADPVTLISSLKIGASVILQRPYPEAPVSPLFVQDKQQTIAFEKEEGKSADHRHHVRVWQIGKNDWLGAATFDRGVGLSLFTLQITHHIGADVDGERDNAGRILTAGGATMSGTESSRIAAGQQHRNGGGDPYRTDGKINDYTLSGGSC